ISESIALYSFPQADKNSNRRRGTAIKLQKRFMKLNLPFKNSQLVNLMRTRMMTVHFFQNRIDSLRERQDLSTKPFNKSFSVIFPIKGKNLWLTAPHVNRRI